MPSYAPLAEEALRLDVHRAVEEAVLRSIMKLEVAYDAWQRARDAAQKEKRRAQLETGLAEVEQDLNDLQDTAVLMRTRPQQFRNISAGAVEEHEAFVTAARNRVKPIRAGMAAAPPATKGAPASVGSTVAAVVTAHGRSLSGSSAASGSPPTPTHGRTLSSSNPLYWTREKWNSMRQSGPPPPPADAGSGSSPMTRDDFDRELIHQTATMAQQDEAAEDLIKGVQRVKHLAVNIRDEVKRQEPVLQQLDDGISGLQGRVARATRDLNKLLDDASFCSKLSCIAVLIVVLLVLTWVLFMF
eukprot:EG_transcript_10366